MAVGGTSRISRWSAAALAAAIIALCPLRAPAQEHPASLNRAETRSLIIAAARLYDLDPELLGAIATVESGGNPEAVSPKGAQGLMQLMPGTAERFSVENPFDPIDNVLGAVRFINFLKRWQAERPELQGSLAELLAAYNAGPGAVQKYGGVPPYPETQAYVRQRDARLPVGRGPAAGFPARSASRASHNLRNGAPEDGRNGRFSARPRSRSARSVVRDPGSARHRDEADDCAGLGGVA